jgi:hypothetical protein
MLTDRLQQRWIAYAAAFWAFIFGVLHFVWAAGWYVGLDPVQTQAAFAVPWKLAYNLVAGVMCIIATPVALALAMPWGRLVPRRVLHSLVWVGTGLLVLRAVASLVQIAYFIATRQFDLNDLGLWEPWFYLGASLFAINLWLYWRSRPSPA